MPKRFRLLSAAMMFVVLAGRDAKASTGRRFTFDPHNLNHAVIEVDVIEDCNHVKDCRVEVLPGFWVKIRSTADAMVSFDRRNDYSASGLVSQNVPDAKLPGNPCIESPFPISHVLWMADFATRGRSPAGWQRERGRFTGTSRSGFSIMEVPGAPRHVCFEPKTYREGDEHKRPLFAALSLRLEADLSKTVNGVSFADAMTRATPILADRVEDAINYAINLEDDNELLRPEAKPHLRLLIAALVGLRVTLDPPNSVSGTYPPPADDSVRRAVHVAVKASAYAAPHLRSITDLDPPGCPGTQKNRPVREYCDRLLTFKSSVAWLNADVETIRAVYGESVTRNFGKSQFVVPVTELLLAELERLRAVTAVQAAPAGAPSKNVFEFLSGVQEVLIELRDAAFQSGDEAPEIAAFMPRLALRWNSVSNQKLIEALWASKAKEDLRVLLAFIDTLKKLPSAENVEFRNLGLIREASPLANGGAVKCGVDRDGGEYCVVDLLTACVNRLACSTKLPFGGHAVYIATQTGTVLTKQPLGTWVRGEEVPVVPRGAVLPGNSQVCSDLPIVSILYRPTNEKLRWTEHSGGVIRRATESQPDRLTVYPPTNNHTFSSKCVVFETKGNDEGAYVIQSVRVKVDLDKQRESLMRTVMVNASRQLKEDLDEGLRLAKVFQPLLPDQRAEINEYVRAIAKLRSDLDTSVFRYVNQPVTGLPVRAAAASLYIRANVVLAALTGHELDAQSFMTSLKQLISQLSFGFGFNSTIYSPAELTKETPRSRKSRDEVLKEMRDLTTETKEMQKALPTEYGEALREYIATLTATCTAVEVTPRMKNGYERYPYLIDPAVKTGAALSVGNASTLTHLLRNRAINRRFIEQIDKHRTWIVETLLANDLNPDLTHKLAPAINVVNFAVDEGARRAGMKWSDPIYGAASRMQRLLRDVVVTAARGPSGDEAVGRSYPELRGLWEAAEFQLFLKRVGRPSLGDEPAVNQIEKVLGLHLPNLNLILTPQ